MTTRYCVGHSESAVPEEYANTNQRFMSTAVESTIKCESCGASFAAREAKAGDVRFLSGVPSSIKTAGPAVRTAPMPVDIHGSLTSVSQNNNRLSTDSVRDLKQWRTMETDAHKKAGEIEATLLQQTTAISRNSEDGHLLKEMTKTSSRCRVAVVRYFFHEVAGWR